MIRIDRLLKRPSADVIGAGCSHSEVPEKEVRVKVTTSPPLYEPVAGQLGRCLDFGSTCFGCYTPAKVEITSVTEEAVKIKPESPLVHL